MVVLEDVGKISVTGNYVHWIIKDFFKLPQNLDTLICSRQFRLPGFTKPCELYIFPKGTERHDIEGWLGMELGDFSYFDGSFYVRMGLIREFEECLMSIAKWDGCRSFQSLRLVSRDEFEFRRNWMAPGGTLHAFCEIQRLGGNPRAKGSAMSKAKPCLKELKNVETSDKAEFGKQEASLPKNIQKLLHELKELLLSGQNSDVTFKIKGKEFKAHRSILAARSPVFSAMMEHEMKEKATGVVDIEDSDPESFPDLLHYLYTGSVENLTSENVLNLYTTADKYQIDELKSMCVKHMMSDISVMNFCDIMTLSLQHHETELTDAATEFFMQNSREIVVTSKWQMFLHENTVAGNELFIKALGAKKQ